MKLEWKNVSGNNRKGFNLKDISFEAEAGYLIGIAGKNGAGKTTMFHYMADKKKQYDGEILLDGELLHGVNSGKKTMDNQDGVNEVKDIHTKQLQYIAYISDDRQFISNYSAIDNAELISVFYENWNKDKFVEAMKRMGLSIGKEFGSMSRGEKLKFQMAFAMGYQPKLYLLDEVTGGMDPVFRKEFFRILREILATEEAIVIMTTHIQEELEEKMDYVGIMENGQLVSFGENEAV